MPAPELTALPRTRSVSPLELGTPPHTQQGPTGAPTRAASDRDTFMGMRGRASPPPPNASFAARPEPSAPTRAQRIKDASRDFITATALAGTAGAWFFAGTPLGLTLLAGWLGYMVATSALELVICIVLD